MYRVSRDKPHRKRSEEMKEKYNIEMTAHLENCPECQQGGVKGTLKIFSLIGCNIYDEHEDESEEFEDEENLSHGFRQKM